MNIPRQQELSTLCQCAAPDICILDCGRVICAVCGGDTTFPAPYIDPYEDPYEDMRQDDIERKWENYLAAKEARKETLSDDAPKAGAESE